MIDVVESMLDAGVKADDVLAWAAVLANAGVAVEHLAESLDEYGSIGALMDAQQKNTSELQSEALNWRFKLKR